MSQTSRKMMLSNTGWLILIKEPTNWEYIYIIILHSLMIIDHHHKYENWEQLFNLRFRVCMSLQLTLKENIPSVLSSGTLTTKLLKDWAAVVRSIRFIEPKQNGTPSLDIWTGQSRTSAPSEIACLYAKSVQPGYSPLAPSCEMTKGIAARRNEQILSC